jgi:hypothetical protein
LRNQKRKRKKRRLRNRKRKRKNRRLRNQKRKRKKNRRKRVKRRRRKMELSLSLFGQSQHVSSNQLLWSLSRNSRMLG